MSLRLSQTPVLAMFGLGLLLGAFLVALIPALGLVVLFVTLLTAAALAPSVAGAPEIDWATALVARLCARLADTWPAFALSTPRDGRLRLFAFLVGVNTALFATFLLRAFGA